MFEDNSSRYRYDKVVIMNYLDKAKVKYAEYVRGFEYQKACIKEMLNREDTEKDIDTCELKNLIDRKNMFLNKIIALEEVFGKDIMGEE